MNPTLDNTSFSSDDIQTLSTIPSEKTPRSRIHALKNEFISNENLQNLTDEIVSLTQASKLHIYFTDTLPKYLAILTDIIKAKKYFSEPEMDAFVTHFYIALLPVLNLRLNSDIKQTVVCLCFQEFLQLYIHFSRATSTYKPISHAKWTETHQAKAQQIDNFVKKFTTDLIESTHDPGVISGEFLISELMLIYAKTYKMMTEKEQTETGIDTLELIRNYAEVFDGLIDKLTCQITRKKTLDLRISNQIAFNAFQTLLTIFESKALNMAYWDVTSELHCEPFDLNFLANLLTFNCKVDPSDSDSTQEISLKVTAKMRQRKAAVIAKSVVEQFDIEIHLWTDPRYTDVNSLLLFLGRFDQVLILCPNYCADW